MPGIQQSLLMSHLVMRRGPTPGKIYELTADIVTIGSGAKNTIPILDNDVSREHCRLIRVMADYELHDLNSKRGTFVSGQRVRGGWLLKPGSIIELGENVVLEYERASAEVEINRSAPPVAHTEKPDEKSHPALVVMTGQHSGMVYPLKSRVVNIGRDLTNDIVIQDPEVSRFHLNLRWMGTTYQVEDLNSTNGTLVNSTPLPPNSPRVLHANDTVQIATMVELRYTWQPDDVKVEKDVVRTKEIPKESHQLETVKPKILDPQARKQTSKLGTGLQPGSLEDHIFIAYAREEWEVIVAPLTVILQDAGYKIWVDQYLAQGGDDWMVGVEQALAECGLLIVVVSPESLNSRYVRLAYRYFFNREKPVIPLLYAGVEEMPLELANLKTIRYDSHNRKGTFDELIAEIRQHKK